MMSLLIAQFIFFNIVYIIAVLKKDFSVIDIAWGLSFLLVFFVGHHESTIELSTRGQLLAALVFLWAIRLSFYIFFRKKNMPGEDYRYAEWRSEWGEKANLIAYFKVFLLQAILSIIVASPLFLFHQYFEIKPFGTLLDYLGLTLWLVGFFFESVGDWQKHVFKSDSQNKGLVYRKGLWKYSRHPNYFGEALLWWGVFFIIINNVPYYYALIGPFILTFLLLKVSGVALLEKQYNSNPLYDEYKLTTNAFIPWFPRRMND